MRGEGGGGSHHEGEREGGGPVEEKMTSTGENDIQRGGDALKRELPERQRGSVREKMKRVEMRVVRTVNHLQRAATETQRGRPKKGSEFIRDDSKPSR
jgi:hypothetical protein